MIINKKKLIDLLKKAIASDKSKWETAKAKAKAELDKEIDQNKNGWEKEYGKSWDKFLTVASAERAAKKPITDDMVNKFFKYGDVSDATYCEDDCDTEYMIQDFEDEYGTYEEPEELTNTLVLVEMAEGDSINTNDLGVKDIARIISNRNR